MNSKAIFSFAILLIFFSLAFEIQGSSARQAYAIEEGYAIASSIENASFERFCIENAFDSIFSESLEAGSNPEEAKEKALLLAEEYVSMEEQRGNKKIQFSIKKGLEKKKFGKESFSEIFVSGELSYEESPKIIFVEVTGGLLRDSILSAKAQSGNASDFFRIPLGYSAMVVK